MRAVETGSSVGSSYVDALAYAVSSCVTEPSWRRGVRHGAGQPASASPAHAKNVLSPGHGVPIAPIVRRETAEHEVGTRLKRNVVALLGRQREIFKMGLAVVARIYPYDHARAPSHREIIVHAKAYSASSPTTKPLASFWGLWHQWVAAERRRPGETSGRTSSKSRCHRPPPRRGKRAVFEGEDDGSEWRNARAKGQRVLAGHSRGAA